MTIADIVAGPLQEGEWNEAHKVVPVLQNHDSK